MTREELYKLIEKHPLILDGATGTNLMKAGMPSGVCPEKWIYDNPGIMTDLQKRYVEAGTKILYAPTFTANSIKLSEYGLSNELEEINKKMVRISREAAGDRAFVAGDLTMTGKQLYPMGNLKFEELVSVYKEQVKAILSEGVDLFVIETMMSLQESRAALLAIKELCDLPVMVSLTYERDGRTLFGTESDVAIITLQEMGADVVGLNCSTGPLDMIPLIEKMRKYARIPILAKPNAGLPELENGETVYKMTPEEFSRDVKELIKAGASIVGGCCGTTPEHIKALCDAVYDMEVLKPEPIKRRVITSERALLDIDLSSKFIVVGERINPTGKKKLQEELRNGSLDTVLEFARAQEKDGAEVLDINMGTNGIDEKEMMEKVIYEVSSITDLPLCIDTSYPEVMEQALRIYPGRALINSISAEDEKIEKMLPLARKYGAMFILLPLNSSGLPKTIEEKHENIETVLREAEKLNIEREAAVVDLLVATVGAESDAAINCFKTLDYCKENNLPTICGLSNISFGLPQRTFVNTAFLNIAISKGLTMAIANPGQELLMLTSLATDLLLNKEGASEKYLERVPEGTARLYFGDLNIVKEDNKKKEKEDEKKEEAHPIFDCVLKGRKSNIVDEVKKEINKGLEPGEIIDTYLIPGINEVGRLFDEKKYFLPQLISGANAMKQAMDFLEPMIVKDGSEKKETIVIATVEGDVHDIGKNLVALMLKNYGYNVIDLGKDVPADDIINSAKENDAKIIGLSALMTTTMMRMEDTVRLNEEMGKPFKIFIGGACITESFAKEIGADAYAVDAADAVRVVEGLLKE